MELVVRAALMYGVLFALIRATGKRELAEMSAFEMVLLIVIGDVVQQGITQEDNSITGAALTAGTLTLMVIATSYVAFRSKRLRGIIDGVAVVIVRDGVLDRVAMRAERLTEQDVVAEARSQGIDSIELIRLAVLESDGRFSFIANSPDTSSTNTSSTNTSGSTDEPLRPDQRKPLH